MKWCLMASRPTFPCINGSSGIAVSSEEVSTSITWKNASKSATAEGCPMSWTEISISVTREATPQAEEALELLGALAITFQDDEDNPVLEPGPGATPLWPTVHVRGLFEEGLEKQPVLAALSQVPGA